MFKGFVIHKVYFDTSISGERGIRTPGPVTVNSFQDCRIRPLCHFSSMLLSLSDCECKYKNLFWFCKSIFIKKHLFLGLIFKGFILFTLDGTYFYKKLMKEFNTLHIRLFLTHIQSFLPVLFPQYWILT